MSKRQFKSSASAARAFGSASPAAFGAPAGAFGGGFGTSSTPLSYLNEQPDLSAISDPHAVVAFKNLSKKDGTTRAKALEDLTSILSAEGKEIEDALLNAWTNLYPRTSIDTSRRVRQLAHSLQGLIASKSGKRIAKHMAGIIGVWLAGLYDNDKAVARAAQDSLALVFATPEKRRALWKAYQDSLLQFCQDVFDKETPQTLSDERSVSPDEANAKFYRVTTATMGVLSGLMMELGEEEFGKNVETYRDIFGKYELWKKAVSEDVAVRRTTHKLLRSILANPQAKACLGLSVVRRAYLFNALDSDQTGSAADFVETAIALTQADNTVWTEKSKEQNKPAACRLKLFVKRGSQGSALNYWASVARLFRTLPPAALPKDSEEAAELLNALSTGITRKGEPRAYIAEGLRTYVQVGEILSAALPEGDKPAFLRDTFDPLISQSVVSKAGEGKWKGLPANAVQVALQEVVKSEVLTEQVVALLLQIAEEVIKEIKLSLPEQASAYSSSQDELGKTGQRFAGLVSTIIARQPQLMTSRPLEGATSEVLKEAINVLVTRNGKPYGAAATTATIIQQCRSLVDESESISYIVEDFLENRIASIYCSPSYKHLAAILAACEDQDEVMLPAWNRCLSVLLADESELQFPALGELIGCRKDITEAELNHLRPELTPIIMPRVDQAWADEGDWTVVSNLLSKSIIASKLFGNVIMTRIMDSLLVPPQSLSALDGLRNFSKSNPSTIKTFARSESGKKLLPNLLLLSESPDELVAKMANEMIPVVQGLIGAEITSDASGNAVVDVIQDGLNTASLNSVSVDTLVNHAKGLVSNKMIENIALLLPNASNWNAALGGFLVLPVNPALAITSPLASVVYLTEPSGSGNTGPVQRDADGLSVPLRMAMYTVKLWSEIPGALEQAPPALYEPLSYTLLLANDHLSIFDPANLWAQPDPELTNEISEIISEGQKALDRLHQLSNKMEKLSISPEEQSAPSRSASAYYTALANGKSQLEKVENEGVSAVSVQEVESRVKQARTRKDVFTLTSELYGNQMVLASSATVTRICNEIVSDLTMLPNEQLDEIGLSQLIVLNTILNSYEDVAFTVQKPRLSRFFTKIVAWLADETLDDNVISELYRVLYHLLPLVSDIFGDYWRNILDSIKDSLELVTQLPAVESPAIIPGLHSALRLFGVLRRVKADESSKPEDERNDDLLEAWADVEADMNAAMLNALKVPRLVPDEMHQPLMIFNELLSREISRIPTSMLSGVEDLYPQLYSQSPAVQQATYRVLHRYIPSKQEQVSLDTVLEKKTGKLPDELLSLILETPSTASLHEEDFERSTPLQLRGYLLSWLLVFDFFTNASHKLRSDYVDSMKEAGHLGDLLDFAFDFLGHAKGKPIDASKFDVTSYNSSAMEDSPLKDTQWLLTHLYYLCLTHLPSLTKNWWIECRSRQKVMSVEFWTAKYMSPVVISTALEAVATWAATQEKGHTADEPPPLAVKINHRAQELTVSYPIDEDSPAPTIVVTLPPTFILHNAKVTSPSKSMAVDQRKWDAWLRITQGVIASSNNSIVDGLLAWRRNVFGAMKGQTECAICYSVVGEDGRVPSKKCRTCRNSFHGLCLYKWFKSSNGTSCPLCRNAFNYG